MLFTIKRICDAPKKGTKEAKDLQVMFRIFLQLKFVNVTETFFTVHLVKNCKRNPNFSY